MATQAALEGLELDLDAARFDAALARLFGGAAGSEASSSEGALALPLEGASLWIGDPSVESGLRMVCVGLPLDLQFEALFLGGGE